MIFSVRNEILFSTKQTPTYIEHSLNVNYFISIHSYVLGEKPLYKSLTFKSKNAYTYTQFDTIKWHIIFIFVNFASNV